MIQILQEAALKGGEVLRLYFRKNLTVTAKTTHQNLVTEADVESQKIVHEYLRKEAAKKLSVPESEIGFIGEEGLYKQGKKYVFAIDPLDGTANFASGFEYFTVEIGLFINGKITCGVVYQPIQDRLYFAEKSKGAFRKDKNGIQRLKILPLNLKDTYFSGGLSIYPDLRKKQLALYDRLHPHFRQYIAIYAVSSALCLVVENVLSVFFAGGSNIWDIAGAEIILTEAGGIMVDWKGKRFAYDLTETNKSYQYMACHQKNLPKILKIMK